MRDVESAAGSGVLARLDAKPGTAIEVRDRLDAERRGTAHLILRDGEHRQRIIHLDEIGERVSIGRSRQAGVSLDWDPEVSRVHAELERLAGCWAIADDGLSMNGTYVNQEPVRARRVLRDGDVLRLGETQLVFRDPAAPVRETTRPRASARPVPVSAAQRRVLIALCRPFASGRLFATPASNQAIADELCLSVDAVKGHVRLLFRAFDVGDVERDKRRVALAEKALNGTIGWHELQKQ